MAIFLEKIKVHFIFYFSLTAKAPSCCYLVSALSPPCALFWCFLTHSEAGALGHSNHILQKGAHLPEAVCTERRLPDALQTQIQIVS